MLLKKSGDFTLTRRGLYAKESNAPRTLCAERRRAGRPEATGAKAATHGGARGGQRVPASLQTPGSGLGPPGPEGTSVMCRGPHCSQQCGAWRGGATWGGWLSSQDTGLKRTRTRKPGGCVALLCFHKCTQKEKELQVQRSLSDPLGRTPVGGVHKTPADC